MISTSKDLSETDYYKKYIGQYAKRFYTPFNKENIMKIIDFKMENGIAYIKLESESNFFWDVDDSVFITNEKLVEDIDRVANINHEQYKGYNPFTDTVI